MNQNVLLPVITIFIIQDNKFYEKCDFIILQMNQNVLLPFLLFRQQILRKV